MSAHLGRLVEMCASISVFGSTNHCVDQVPLIVCEGFVDKIVSPASFITLSLQCIDIR